MNMNPDSRPRVSASGRITLGLHLALLLVVTGYLGLCLAVQVTGGDASMGLATGLLALGVLGLPWTFTALLSEQLTFDSATFVAIAVAGAALNLALHAFLWRLSRSRTAAR